MIIYIHGFGSSGFAGKATLFKEHFGENLISPSLSYVPKLAINTLKQLIEILLNKDEEVSLIGSSLGGYYSIYLANKYDLKAVLINPAITPYKTLDKVGYAKNYFDDSTFEVKKEHLEFLEEIEVNNIKNEKNFMLLLQKGDELLDYNDALKKLPNSNISLENGGNHSFENIQRYFMNINDFIK